MIDHLLRDLQVLRKADMLIGKIWLNVLARRLGLFAFAGLIGLFGLGMANVAGYNALQSSIGMVWAATVVAIADFAIAAIAIESDSEGLERESLFGARFVSFDFAGFSRYVAEIPAHISKHTGKYIVQDRRHRSRVIGHQSAWSSLSFPSARMPKRS